MGKLLLALYDKKGYMKSLAEYYGKKNFLMESRLFTKRESLVGFLAEHQLDVLLLGQEVETYDIPHLDHVNQVIVLSEGERVEESQEFPVIFKYQSAEKILKEIFQITLQDDIIPSVVVRKVDVHIDFIAIYRPYGDLLSYQKVVSEEKDREKKSLLINMELLGGLELSEEITGWECDSPHRGLSEFIFYLKQNTNKLSAKLSSLIQKRDGIDYLYPVEDYRDLYSMNREDIDRMLSLLADYTDYERVLFHVGFLNDTSLYLLYCCDRVFLPQAKNSWEENQRKAVEKLLVREGMSEIIGSIQYVSV